MKIIVVIIIVIMVIISVTKLHFIPTFNNKLFYNFIDKNY